MNPSSTKPDSVWSCVWPWGTDELYPTQKTMAMAPPTREDRYNHGSELLPPFSTGELMIFLYTTGPQIQLAALHTCQIGQVHIGFAPDEHCSTLRFRAEGRFCQVSCLVI